MFYATSFGVIGYAAIVPRILYSEVKCPDQNWLLALNENAFLILFLCARMTSLMMYHIVPSHFLTYYFILIISWTFTMYKTLNLLKSQASFTRWNLNPNLPEINSSVLLMALQFLLQWCHHSYCDWQIDDQLDHFFCF